MSKFFCLASSIVLSVGTVLTGQYLQPYAPYFSQGGQDKFANETIFKSKRNGVFFDIGAHDGVSYSNTYYFEKELGWTGVCVEPQKNIFEQLRKNRKCACLHGCVFDRNAKVQFLQVNGPSEMLSGILETCDPRHIDRAHQEVAQLGGSLQVLDIPAYTFTQICEMNKITHVDFLSIDTEGSEERIIKAIDFNKVSVDVITVEDNFRDHRCETHLRANGFERVATIGPDDVYKRTQRG